MTNPGEPAHPPARHPEGLPSSYSTITQRQEWALLVEGFERARRLHACKPGELAPMADYLYSRTGGYIVFLSHLIREAAIITILSGAERIWPR